MVPRKLVEHLVGSLPLLLLPIVLAPVLFLALQPETIKEYQAVGTVWASNPDDIDVTSLDSSSGRAAPAGRLASVLTDLLRTRNFRESVAIAAGLIDPATATPEAIEQATAVVGTSTNVRARGTFLVTISSRSPNPLNAQAIAAAVITEYERRNDLEVDRQVSIAGEFFSRRLEIAQTELDKREGLLISFLEENPEVELTRIGADFERLASLRRSVATQEAVVADLQLSVQDVTLEAATSSLGQEASFLVQDLPRVPQTPLPGSTVETFGYPLVALAFGAMISASYLYVRFRMDHTVRASEDLLGVAAPLLGIVPDVSSKDHQPWYRRLRRRERNFARRVASSIIVDSGSGQAGP